MAREGNTQDQQSGSQKDEKTSSCDLCHRFFFHRKHELYASDVCYPAAGRPPKASLQVKFESVQNTDRVEPFPWLAEREADLLVIRDRALKIVERNCGSKDVTRGFIVLMVIEPPSSAGVLLMQWNQGRTRPNLLHSVREAKQKRRTHQAFF